VVVVEEEEQAFLVGEAVLTICLMKMLKNWDY
jgi:hypothetical protein